MAYGKLLESITSACVVRSSPLSHPTSKLKLDFQLNHSHGDVASARGAQNACGRLFQVEDPAEIGVSRVVGREPEIRMIEKIEELEPYT